MEPLQSGLVLLITLVVSVSSFPQSTSRLAMIYLNHTLDDGEDVLVIASPDQTRKEALVTCVARKSDAHQSLVFQFYAQNSILRDPKDSWSDNDDVEGLTIGRRLVVLESGGFLRLKCAITTHNSTKPVASVSANFTFAYRDSNQPPSLASRPQLWPVPANTVYSPSSTRRSLIPPSDTLTNKAHTVLLNILVSLVTVIYACVVTVSHL